MSGSTGRHLGLAAIVLVVSSAVVFSPLALNLGEFNKYVVALGLIGICTGLSFGLNALIDLFVRRR